MINKSLSTFIRDKHYWVLRRKKDKCPLNVSYTVEGLMWTTNKLGKSLFFKDAIVSNGRIVPKKGYYEEADDVFYEKFDPLEHATYSIQTAELRWLDKAMRMSY